MMVSLSQLHAPFVISHTTDAALMPLPRPAQSLCLSPYNENRIQLIQHLALPYLTYKPTRMDENIPQEHTLPAGLLHNNTPSQKK